MRSFRDRNPYLVGLASVGAIAVMVGLAFMVGILHIFERTYAVDAVFSDSSGVRGGDDVKVAGIKAGRVVRVVADRDAGNVIVKMVVNDSVKLGLKTTAEIALATLLGSKFVRLSGKVEAPYLKDVPRQRRVIPIERTKTPFDVFELVKVATTNINATDTDRLNQFINQLAAITEGKHDQVAQLLEGINRFSTEISARDQQLRELLDRAATFSATLAQKDQTLVALVDQSRGILDLLSRRRADVARGLESANLAIGQLAGVITGNKTAIDGILDTLHPTLDVIDRRQGDVDRALAWLGAGALGLAYAPAHGPWADIYVRAVGPDLVGLLQALGGSG